MRTALAMNTDQLITYPEDGTHSESMLSGASDRSLNADPQPLGLLQPPSAATIHQEVQHLKVVWSDGAFEFPAVSAKEIEKGQGGLSQDPRRFLCLLHRDISRKYYKLTAHLIILLTLSLRRAIATLDCAIHPTYSYLNAVSQATLKLLRVANNANHQHKYCTPFMSLETNVL